MLVEDQSSEGSAEGESTSRLTYMVVVGYKGFVLGVCVCVCVCVCVGAGCGIHWESRSRPH